MRILIVGGSGMLGSDVAARLATRHELFAPSSSDLDITDPESVAQLMVGQFGDFDWCVNCAGYTAVDRAESEQREAAELNAIGPAFLARACAASGIKLVHISTDFVFDGTASEPYREDSVPNPQSSYGKTKLGGEAAALEGNSHSIVIRTSWLFGPNGPSFPRTIIRAWEAGKPLRVVRDQIGCPTYTGALAEIIEQAVDRNLFPGIYHASGPDSMSWLDLANLTLESWKKATGSARDITIEGILATAWTAPAKRPAYSVLSNSKLAAAGIGPMPPLRESLREFCARLAQRGLD